MFEVTTDGSKSYEFFNFSEVGFMHQLNAHDGVIVEKSARIFLVCSNSADDGNKMDNDVGVLIFVHSFYVFKFAQVVLKKIRYEDMLTPSILFEFSDEMSAKETFPSCNGYSLSF